MFQTLHRSVLWVAQAMAILAGVALSALIVMICLSILGRTATSVLHSGFAQTNLPALADWLLATGIGPIRGDFELVESSMAFVIFGFLVWCQVTSGHATVDIFTDKLRARSKRVLQALIEIALAATLVLVAIKLHEGMNLQHRRNSTTFVLQFPLWWSYAAALVPAYLAAAVSCYMALVRLAEAMMNRALIPGEGGAAH
jgi:TRAP-type C4-dicarboxylate transport system permease small subunit